MKIVIALLTVCVALNAAAADTTATASASLAITPTPLTAPAEHRSSARGSVTSPKIHAIRATRNADGSLAIGCVERENPQARKSSIATPVSGAAQ